MAEPEGRKSERPDDEFDRIVEGLDLDMSVLDEDPVEPPAAPTPRPPAELANWTRGPDEPDEDEPFYRHVTPPARPWNPGSVLAWAAVLGSPAILLLTAIADITLPRQLLASLALAFVAGAAYMVTQLPEHGPADRDDPDDGAVL